MGAANEVRVSYVANIAGLKTQLEAAGNISKSETRQIIADLQKVQKARLAEAKIANQIAAQTKTNAVSSVASTGAVRAGWLNLGNQLSDVASQLSTGTNPMTILVQQGPQAAGALQMMGVSMAAVGAAAVTALPVLVTIGGLGAVYYRLSGDIERAADVTKTYHEVNQALLPTLRAIEDAEIRRDVAIGAISATMGEVRTAQLGASRGVKAFAAAQKESREEIEQSTTAAKKWVERLGGMAGVAGVLDPIMGWSDTIATGAQRLESLNDGVITEVGAQKQLRDILIETAAAEELARRTKEEATDAARAAAAAAREQARALSETLDAMKAESGMELARVVKIREGREKLQATTAAADVAALSGIEKVAAARDLAIQGINEEEVGLLLLARSKAEMGLIDADAAAARVATETKASAEIKKIRDQEDADAAKAADKKLKEQIAAIEQSVSAITRVAEGAAAAAGAAYDSQADAANKLREQLASGDEYYTDAQKKQLTKQVKAHETAARRAWQIEHGVAIGVATTNMFLAIGKAAASAPWPLNLIPMAGAAASTAPLVASVAAQKPAFHSGRAPDEIDATLTRREAVMSPQGVSTMGGPQAVHNANAGVSQAGGSVVMHTTVYRHNRLTDRIETAGLRRRGPTARAILASSDPYWRRK